MHSHRSPSRPTSRPRLALVLVLALTAAHSTLYAATAADVEVVERRATAMGTVLQVEARASSRAAALLATEAALEAVEEVEGRLSTWRSDSELTRLNRAPLGQWVELSPALATTLTEVLAWRAYTAGAFDPLVAPLVRVWALRGGGRWPAGPELAAARAASSAGALELVGRHARRHHPDAGFEEGGFGKGLAMREAAAAALTAGASCVALNFGGQIHRAGDCPPVEVEVAHPEERGRPVATLLLTTGGLATSGNSERGAVVEGRPLGHLLDPRSGRPCPFGGSVTVIADDPLTADVLSTALFVLGPEAGSAWLEGPCWAALRVDAAGPEAVRASASRALASAIKPAAGVTLTVLEDRHRTDITRGGCP